MKKVVLIATFADYSRELSVFDHTTPISPPLGILSLGSYLKAHNIPVNLIDIQMDFGFGVTKQAEKSVVQRVARYLCDEAHEIAWIGISQISVTDIGVALAQAIRSMLPDIPIILGGYFPSGNYETLLKEYPYITAIVRGDGELAALEISRSLAEGRSFLSDQTPNLAWREGQRIRTSPIKPMALDSLPLIDFHLLRHPTDYPSIDLVTSRGCPYSCNYCLEATMRPYTTYPTSWVDNQLRHLEMVVSNKSIGIFDPIFGIGKKRALEISKVFRERHFSYCAESRVDVLSTELIPILSTARVEMLYIGFESASVDTLLRMNKVPSRAKAEAYVEDSLEILGACFEKNITPVIGFMVGFPGDYETDLQASLTYAKEVRRLYDEVANQTGIDTGFIFLPFYQKIYEGSSLAKRLERDFPGVVLQDDPFIGSKSVLQTSPGVKIDMVNNYVAEISKHDLWSPTAVVRAQKYMLFPMRTFLEEHPELIDKEGVVSIGNSLRHAQ